MNSKIKRILAVLLSAVMVMSMTFVSTAAGPRYERPELNKADTVKTTGTWTQDANGFWSLTSENKKVSGGWYYANMLNSLTEYRWYYLDEKGIMATGWVIDKKDPDIWYYTGESKDKTEGSLITGWVTDPQDGQKYYLDPATGMMSHGWVKIDNSWYYFCQRQYAVKSWAPNQTGHWTASNQTGHSYGSLYRNETTPDGYYVDSTGAWRQSSGGSSSGSSSGGGGRPTPKPTPTPTPEPVMTAKATTSTAQYAGQSFNTDGLTIKVYKDGVEYKTVDLPDPSITITKVTVNGEVDGTLTSGSNEVSIGFLYYDPAKPDVIIGQSLTTEVFTVEGIIAYTVTFNANGHGTAPAPITNVTYGSKITAPTAPTAAKCTFDGWYKEAGCTNAWDFASDTVTEDTTLYARWICFSVSADTVVEFSPGLLYADASDLGNIKYGFESDQVTFINPYSGGTYDNSHLNYFYWSKDASVAVAKTYDDQSAAIGDTFFTEQSGFTVDGETGWRTLSKAEWDYLIDGRTINGGSGYGKTCKCGMYPDTSVDGLFIANDNYAGFADDYGWEEAAIADGCVFLPLTGYRGGTSVDGVGFGGGYWSATPCEDDEYDTYGLGCGYGIARTFDYYRYDGRCVRLVK